VKLQEVLYWEPLRLGFYLCAKMALTATDKGETFTLKPYFCIFVAHFLYSDLCNYKSSINANSSVLISCFEANFVAPRAPSMRNE